jgi:glutathione S-transferase
MEHGMGRPTLWHIPISHYAEKVRWALALKGVEHRRISPPPGGHIPIVLALTRGRSYTIPVLSLDGRHIGDSTEIIAALEERYPEPPLYPEDPEDRTEALALEDYFDDRAGPATRQLTFHAFRDEPDRFSELAARSAPPPLARLGPVLGAYGRVYTALRWNARDAAAAERSREAIREVLDRIEAELGDGEYLVGEQFSVADLTAAALLYPLVHPPGAPVSADTMPAAMARFREELGGSDRPAMAWVGEMYRRHRKPASVAGAVA